MNLKKDTENPNQCSVKRCKEPPAGKFIGAGYLCNHHAEEWKPPAEESKVQILQVGESWKEEVQATATEFEENLKVLEGYEAKTDEEVADVTEELGGVKSRWNALEEKRKSITQPINQALREVNKLFKPAQNALREYETCLKGILLRTKQAREMEQIKLLESASSAEDPKTVLELASATTLQAEGVSFRENWKWEIVDLDKVPREYLTVDSVKLNTIVKVLKERADIPGIRFYNEPIVVSRSA